MNFRKYLNLLRIFFSLNLQSQLEYRKDLFFWVIVDIIWVLFGILGINLIFNHIEAIAGWTKNEVLLLYFISLLFGDLCGIFIYQNLNMFSYLIRYGMLENFFLKPLNLRFLLSCNSFQFDYIGRITLSIIFIWRYIFINTGGFSFINFLLFLFLLACGFFIFYSLFFMLTLTNIWFINLANLLDIFIKIKEMGNYPIYIFKKGLRLFFTFFLPLGFIATFPAEALLGRISFCKIILAPALTLLFLYFSHKFFYFALKHYSSASG